LLPNAGTSLGFKVTGHSINDGIEDGDVLIVDTSRSVTRECIAVATINGQHTIKRFRPDGNRLYIISDRSAPREAPHDCEIFGVATHIFRALPD
jgi:SOS-response transcriptional repressor LexA